MKSTNNEAAYRVARVELAQKAAYEALTVAINTLKSATREIERHRETFVAANGGRLECDSLNWTINHLASNILGNCRLDSLANAQADLASAWAEIK